MAAGLPFEGEGGPYSGESLVDVPTCSPSAKASDVDLDGAPGAAVISAEGLAVGWVDEERLGSARPEATVLEVMELIPDTIRPSVPLSDLDERTAGRLVTTSEGVLLGALDPAALSGDENEDVNGQLRRRLIDEGRTPEEADTFLNELVEQARS